MTPRQRYMTALRGGIPDRTPFVVYESKIPQSAQERAWRNRGMLIMMRHNSYDIVYPNVITREERYHDEAGRWVIRRRYETPVGTLSTVDEPVGFTAWHHEQLFKTPDDYKAIAFMFGDAQVVPRYDRAAKLAADLGEDFVVRDAMGSEPLQQIIYHIMGSGAFCYEWMDRRDEIMALADIITQTRRATYGVVAEGPLEFANYGGNVAPEIIGPKTFRDLYLPAYAEAAEALHKRGKLLGCHLDACNAPIMGDIADSALDYIEAYDPGMSPPVSQARAAFGDKVLSIHWPSGWAFLPREAMIDRTLEMIDAAAPGNGFIIGITEDVPPDRVTQQYTAVMDAIDMRPLKG